MADFIDFLYRSDITVITFPRNISRSKYASHIFELLDIYCTVIDPTHISPQVDIIIFTSPNKINLDLTNVKAAIIILSTWGDSVIESSKLIQYLSPFIENFKMSYKLEASLLNHKQLLYYDRVTTKMKDESKKVALYNLIANHLYSPRVMENIIENEKYDINDDEKETELYPKLKMLISKLNEYDQGTALVYTAVPNVVNNLLNLSKTNNSFFVFNDESYDYIKNIKNISSIHILDGYSLTVIKTILENVFENESYSEINMHIYVSIHPDMDSEDILKYELLSNQIDHFDEIYETATQSYFIDSENKIYKWDM